MVTIDESLCTGCGSCAAICHEHCMKLVDGIISIDYRTCSTCTQCIALCPERALSWDEIAPVAYDEARLPSPEQIDELFKQRRTVRRFRREPIDRTLIKEIVSYGAYAPTHNFELRYVVVDDRDTIDFIDTSLFEFVRTLHALLFKSKLLPLLSHFMPAPLKAEFARLEPKINQGLKSKRGLGGDTPALIFIVGDRRIPLTRDSAQYALHNISLYAQSRHIGSRNLVGNLPAFNGKAVRRRLHLQKSERIFGVVALGYPAARFRNKVLGLNPDIGWI
jgi:nitroreductase/NAD-dependent dihydropyrimidine dehydrogenase PreA subunit